MRSMLLGAVLLLLIGGGSLHSQAPTFYSIPLRAGARVSLVRQQDALSVDAAVPGDRAGPYGCERPLAIARQWADAHATTLAITPGDGTRGTGKGSCGLAIREVRDLDSKAPPTHYLEMSMHVFHLIVPLTDEEARTLSAVLKEVTG